MKCPPIPETEQSRLHALAQYELGDEKPLPDLDPVVKIAARMFGMPVAAVNMVGSDHVFFAASYGVGTVDMSPDVSFCAHAITQGDVMVVPDTTHDERFHDNPLVTGDTHVRFYAGVPLLSPDGHALGALCVLDSKPRHDFSDEDRARLRELARMADDRLELRRAEVKTDRAQLPLAELARDSTTPVIWFDSDHTILAWNDAAAALLGYSPQEGIGLPIDAMMPGRARDEFSQLIAAAVAAGTVDKVPKRREIRGLRKDGVEIPLGISLFSWHQDGRLHFNVVLADLSQRRKEEKELERLASIDTLTGLCNRRCFYRAVEENVARGTQAALVIIDLDGFKDVNDTLGHTVGDGILCEVARRLITICGARATVARIGGDEFAVLLPDVMESDRAIALAQAAIADLSKPILIEERQVHIGASAGIALFPIHAEEALELVSNADLALFQVKKSARGNASVFVPTLRQEATARRLYGMELHRAAHEGEFLLHYQPQIRLSDGSLAGAEALIRWRHPQKGLLPPSVFLPTLEGGPLAATVGSWILDEACAQAALWRRSGALDFRMGVNLFAAQFRMGNLASEVIEALARHGLAPDTLELEITENIALDHDDVVLETLQRIHDHGVGIALDDFGTGYASLSFLKRYPLTRIKIDRSFVQNMIESRQDASVIRAILDMAQSFSLQTVAEGIETDDQRHRLRRQGCEEGQGYLFGKPMPASQFAEAFGIAPPLRKAANG